jgi:hypothetical protein
LILGGYEQITNADSGHVGWFDLPGSWFVDAEAESPASFIGLPVGFDEG